MPQWTEQQQQAIQARNGTLLISAAAGSGKTAVLVERIMSLLREGASLDRMLIVTFTRAAAAEMRQRLHRRLSQEAEQEPGWTRQLDLLPQAQISTIHGFCQTVLRGDFQAAGVDPLARICNEATGKALFQQAMKDAMNDLCEKGTADFQLLMDAFSQEQIFDMCDGLEHFLMSLPHPFQWLEDKLNAIPLTGELTAHPWYQALLRHAPVEVEGLMALWDRQEQCFGEPDAVTAYRSALESDRLQLASLEHAPAENLLLALSAVNFCRAPAVRGLSDGEKAWKDRYLSLRKDMKDAVKALRDSLAYAPEQVRGELCQVQRLARGLGEMTRATHERFQQAKRKRNLIDFSDLEQMTLAVLDQAPVREKLQGEWDHIFVDECQDVSAIQDAILQRVHGANNCLFMVGDVKQSIYRFRLADPTLFLGRMRTFGREADSPERRITLQMNFRSDGNVLESTNIIFRKLLRRNITELDYAREDELIPPPDRQPGAPAELCLIRDPGSDPQPGAQEDATLATALEREALRCGERILSLRRGDEGKPYAFRDMVILMPKVRNAAQRVAELLESLGIPVYCDMKGAYFDLPEIRAMLYLLQVLDNPLQDIPLLSTLKLPGFHVTDGELADIRLTDSGKNVPFHRAFRKTMEADTPLGKRCRDIWQSLERWRFLLTTQPLSAFLWNLMEETGFYAAVGALPEGQTRQANLRLLCQRVTEYEQVSDGSLQGFLQSAEELRAGGESRSATLLGEEEDLVRIMTIHKSKGLEFPVVFVLGLEQRVYQAPRGFLRCHNELGVCLPYVNKPLRIRRTTLGDQAFVLRKRADEMAERARLLYVAMTRARERLLLFASPKDMTRGLWFAPQGDYRVWQGQSMLDWVMCALMDEPALRAEYARQLTEEENRALPLSTVSTGFPQPATPWKIRVYAACSPQPVQKNKVIHSLFTQLETWLCEGAGDKLGKRWAHIYDPGETLPLKTSVSSLVRGERERLSLLDAPEEETPAEKRQGSAVVPLLMEELPALPAFLRGEESTGARRGTLLHKAFSLTDLEALRALPPEAWRESLQEQKAAWVSRQLFTPQEAALLRPEDLLRFYTGPLGRRLLASPLVKREWSFNFRLSHEKETLLQGVMDCAFREGDGWVLLDYKTDRVEDPAAFAARYAPQLRLYAQALGEITALPVREMWLYAVGNGQAYPVPPGDAPETEPGRFAGI